MAEPEIQRGVELYLAYFQEAQRLHLSELGHELEMHKDTEPLCIEKAFERLVASKHTGTGFIAEILQELAWSQCLGNGNHRTAILFLVDFAGPVLGDHRFADELVTRAESWVISSQTIIRRREEWGFNQKNLEERHWEATRRWVSSTFNQSDSLMILGPKRLLNFLSGSNSSSVRDR